MKLHLILLSSGLAFATTTALAQLPGLSKLDPKVAQCQQKLGPAHKSILDIMAKGRAAGAITPAEEAEFRNLDQNRAKDWATKSQGGVTLAECEAHLKLLENERQRVTVLAARQPVPPTLPPKADPQVAACQAKLGPLHKSIIDTMAKGRATGSITPAEEAEFRNLDQNRAKDWATKSQGGVTLAECEAHLKLLENERQRVTVMAGRQPVPPSTGKPPLPFPGTPPAKGGPEVAACQAKLGPLHKSIIDTMAKGRATGSITPAEEAEFRNLDQNRAKDWAAKSQGGVTLAECEAHLKLLESERQRVNIMAGRLPVPPAGAPKAPVDPRIDACLKQLNIIRTSINETVKKSVAAGTISAAEAADLGKLAQANQQAWTAKTQGGVTQAACDSQTKLLQDEQQKVNAMAARPKK